MIFRYKLRQKLVGYSILIYAVVLSWGIYLWK